MVDSLQNFPVYDILYEKVNGSSNTDTPLSIAEIHDLKKKIEQLDSTGKDMIYVIIKTHGLRFSETKLLDLPFGGQRTMISSENNNGNGEQLFDLKFDIKKFPIILDRILLAFCDLHLRKIQEDTEKAKVLFD